MTKDEINQLVTEISNAIPKMFGIAFARPNVGFFNTSVVAGKAHYKQHFIEFNEKLMDQEGFDTTVVHELAHLVVGIKYPNYKQAHGPEFKHVMTTLGHDPRTYHTYDVSQVKRKRMLTRHIGTCGCAGLEHKFTAQSAKKWWDCKVCRQRIIMTGEVRKVSNV